MVKWVKKVLETAKDDDEVVEGLMSWNQTPLTGDIPAPIQVHFGRNFRDFLHTKVKQASQDWEEIRNAKLRQRDKQKQIFDRATKDLRPLTEGEPVLY